MAIKGSPSVSPAEGTAIRKEVTRCAFRTPCWRAENLLTFCLASAAISAATTCDQTEVAAVQGCECYAEEERAGRAGIWDCLL